MKSILIENPVKVENVVPDKPVLFALANLGWHFIHNHALRTVFTAQCSVKEVGVWEENKGSFENS